MKSDGDLILCTVIVSAPEYGLAILDTYGGTAETKERLLGLLPYSDATCGAILQLHIQEGSTVVCMRSLEVPRMAFVITPINKLGADMTDTLNGHVFYATNRFTTWDEWIWNATLDDLKDFAGSYFRSHANSVDKDVLPGDVDIVNNGGPASLHIGKYITQLKGSPLAFIDVAAIEDRIRMVASQVDTHTLNNYQHVSDEVSVDDTAADVAEAFGLTAGTDIESNWDTVTNETVPLFRLQETKGPAVDGKESIVVGFPDGSDTHTDHTVPPVLSKDRTAISGERTIASARGINSVKSPALQAILQFGYHYVNSHTTDEKKLDLLTPYEMGIDEPEEEKKAPDLNQEVMDAAINKVVDKLLTKDYLPVLMQRMMSAGLIVSNAPLSTKFDEHTEFGPTTAAAYPLPKFLTLKDSVTGQEHLYFDSTSFITQEPDGSILLKDGYGSEIRMSQGNIYISPALDLQLRPGRDMWGLIPRHMALDSQGFSIINSNKAIYLRSTGDMQLAAATEGRGKLTIECDDKTSSKESGLILRSLGNAAFTGHDLYIGINRGDSRTENRVETPDRSGSIILDAGYNGVLMEKGMVHMVDTSRFTVVTTGDYKTNSALTIAGNAIGLYAQVVNMPASLRMAPVDGSQKVSVLDGSGGETQIDLSVSSNPNILMKQTTISNGQIHTMSHILSLGTVQAKQVAAVSVKDGILDKKESFPDVDVPNTKTDTGLEEGTGASVVQKLSQTIYQDFYIGANCFQFPEDAAYGVQQSLTVPGMAWQDETRSLVDDLKSVTWEEKPITVQGANGEVSTACYPGWAAWSSEANISQAGYELKPLKNNYITNTKKETKNA